MRIALGASTRRASSGSILAQAMRPVALGAAVGVVGALAASRVLASQLFGVSRTDPLTIARGRRHTHRRGARGERRAGAARGGGRPDARAAIGVARGRPGVPSGLHRSATLAAAE